MTDPLLLLPGMMCDGRLFAPQIAQFSSQRSVHLGCLAGGDSIELLASNVLENAPPTFALAGLSMGGIVAMEMVRLAPERISRLALMDTNPLAETPQRARDREPQMTRVKAGGLREIMRDEMKPSYLAETPYKAQTLDLCMQMAQALGPDVFIQQSKALQSRRDQSQLLRGVRVPTLILCGAEDTLCPPERHALMQNLVPGSHLAVIQNAGHLPVLEQPGATNDALAAWMAR